MKRPSTLIWMVFILLLVLPTPAGKIIIDLASGIFLVIALIPLILGGVGWYVWNKIQSQLKTCEVCGSSFVNDQLICPVCGKNMDNKKDIIDNIPASSATIDIKSENID